MIKGLDLFREHFAGMDDQYILIGGAACDVQMSQTPFPFRATHDLEIVHNDLQQLGIRRKPEEILQLLTRLLGE